MNTHRVRLYFEDGSVHASLICPSSGCQPITACGNCGRDFDDTVGEPCESCAIDKETAGECWLAQWAGASPDLLEWLEGEITIEVNGVFDCDEPTVEVYEPDPLALVHWSAA